MLWGWAELNHSYATFYLGDLGQVTWLPWVLVSSLINWDALRTKWYNKYNAPYQAHSKNSEIGKKAEEKKEVNINFLVELCLCPAVTHSEHPLTVLAHIFMLPRGRTDRVQEYKIYPLQKCGFKLWEWGSPSSPSSPHPESNGDWRKVRKEGGKLELFCQVTLLGGGHSAQALSLATEAVIQYLNPFLLQSVALCARWTEPEWCRAAPEKLLHWAVSFRLGKEYPEGRLWPGYLDSCGYGMAASRT